MKEEVGMLFVKTFILMSLLVWWLAFFFGAGIGLLFLSIQQSIGLGMVVGFGGWVLGTVHLTRHIMKASAEALIETLAKKDIRPNDK